MLVNLTAQLIRCLPSRRPPIPTARRLASSGARHCNRALPPERRPRWRPCPGADF